jgi:deazaflavin-dependent oxidoreductase (nitroreductase family)
VTAGDAEFLYLTTTGRRSGQPREIEIWFTHHEGRYYLIAEHRDQANWVQNLRANPRVHIRVAGSSMEGTARVMDAKAERTLWQKIQALSEKKYGWGDGLIVEITPVGEEGADAARRPTTAHEV